MLYQEINSKSILYFFQRPLKIFYEAVSAPLYVMKLQLFGFIPTGLESFLNSINEFLSTEISASFWSKVQINKGKNHVNSRIGVIDHNGKVLSHFTTFNSINNAILHLVAEIFEIGIVINLGSHGETLCPSENTGN